MDLEVADPGEQGIGTASEETKPDKEGENSEANKEAASSTWCCGSWECRLP